VWVGGDQCGILSTSTRLIPDFHSVLFDALVETRIDTLWPRLAWRVRYADAPWVADLVGS
jgi:hypothetical protein